MTPNRSSSGALIACRAKRSWTYRDWTQQPSHRKCAGCRRPPAKYFQANPAGSRELPRLAIMTGFFEYRFSEFGRARELFSGAAHTCRQMRDWDCYAIASQNVALLEYEGKNYTIALSAFADALRSLPAGTGSQAGR